MTLHRGAAAKISAAMDDPSSPIYGKCQVLATPTSGSSTTSWTRGQLRDGVESRQVVRLVSGVASVADAGGMDQRAVDPMLDIVIDGILRDSATS